MQDTSADSWEIPANSVSSFLLTTVDILVVWTIAVSWSRHLGMGVFAKVLSLLLFLKQEWGILVILFAVRTKF